MKTSILCLFVLLAAVSAQFSNYYCSHDNCNGMNCREMGSNYRCMRNYYQRYGPFRNRNCYCRDMNMGRDYYNNYGDYNNGFYNNGNNNNNGWNGYYGYNNGYNNGYYGYNNGYNNGYY